MEDRVCDWRCSKGRNSICDIDCFSNEKDMVNEARDCIDDFEEEDNGYRRSRDEDRICDADSHMVLDYICDIDCLNNGTSILKICDMDCNKYGMYMENGVYFSSDGFCDLDCGYVEGHNGVMTLYVDGVCDLDCAIVNNVCDPDCGDSYDVDCGTWL